jgi:hypothetical protein
VTAVRPHGQSRVKAPDIPKIRLLTWLGLESALWGVVISHLVKWTGNTWYFLTWQVRYAVGYGKNLWTVWYLKDWWDRLPVHISNALGYRWADQGAPAWWATWRHDIRDVGIALVATIVVTLMFSKPKYPAADRVSLARYLITLPAALAAALVPIALIGVLAWKLPWLTQHGWQVPAAYGALASEVNGFIAAGTWITVLMGVLGGLAARPFVRRVADDIQWFFAERSAVKVRDESGLNRLRGTRVIGTPAHRVRVHWLLDHRTRAAGRSPWVVRILLAVAFLAVLASGFGAWLTLAGPAAVH